MEPAIRMRRRCLGLSQLLSIFHMLQHQANPEGLYLQLLVYHIQSFFQKYILYLPGQA
jgi:hypothetical protein